MDGTQKLARDGQWWNAEWLQRQHQGKDGGRWTQQYVYVLEANWVFHNGLTIPLLSEFLSYGEGDPDDHKQDCEQKAFKRLAERLKAYFKRWPILLLLDGLYPTGPVMEQCRRYHWDDMIVLPQPCLPSVWEEVESLSPWQPANHWSHPWRGRQQQFQWVNDIEYGYDHDTRSRYRWGIEISMLVEKRQGYHYEHAFSYDWNAMKGFHDLMRLAHLLNAIAQYTKRVAKQVRTQGVRAFLKFVRETCTHPWLSPQWIQQLLATPIQLRLE